MTRLQWRRWLCVVCATVVLLFLLPANGDALRWNTCYVVPDTPEGTECTVCHTTFQIGSETCSVSMIYCSNGYSNAVSTCW